MSVNQCLCIASRKAYLEALDEESTMELFCKISERLLSVKGAMKLYFMYYSRVVVVLFSTGLYNSTYSFGKTRFSALCVLVLRVSISLAFRF